MYGTDVDGPNPENPRPENSDVPCDTAAETYEGKWQSAGRSASGEDHARRRLEELIAQRMPTDTASEEDSDDGGETDVASSEADAEHEQPD